ncbi:OmpA family protein [Kordiimonas sp. SCSIO 12603]|uniref:OmpA family protein n=1 Tax=Kordiimonas sp. SCSIO 12603 TaxID=2829596 RepID=UPI0021038415|nr:OmpA family protein [Kordiimonas sp. SCSIO 12603]UTW57713.1 OmpA family protein [Kordiimonas sp. SCSIO 12603]
MRKILLPLLASTMSISAFAEEDNHFYAGVEFGISTALKSNLTGEDLTLRADKHWGRNGGLFIGKKIDKTRFEFEYMIRSNTVDSFVVEDSNLPAFPERRQLNGAGRQKTSSLMVNAWRTFATWHKWDLDAGFGFGVARTRLDNIRQGANNFVDGSDWAPAVQAMVQASYPMGKGANFSLGYRLFRAFKAEYDTPNGEFSHRARSNEFFARLSWKFGSSSSAPRTKPATAAPVAQPAAPAPTPVETKPVTQVPEKPLTAPKPAELPLPGPYIVYFDFDKSNVSARGMSTISEAAEAFRNFKAVEIKTTGKADRAGNSAYNVKLAERRTAAVRAALIREGVPANKIDVRSTGENEPRVPTADGVREQENRVVVIVLVR